MYVCMCKHTYIHTYKQTYIHTYIHTYIQAESSPVEQQNDEERDVRVGEEVAKQTGTAPTERDADFRQVVEVPTQPPPTTEEEQVGLLFA